MAACLVACWVVPWADMMADLSDSSMAGVSAAMSAAWLGRTMAVMKAGPMVESTAGAKVYLMVEGMAAMMDARMDDISAVW